MRKEYLFSFKVLRVDAKKVTNVTCSAIAFTKGEAENRLKKAVVDDPKALCRVIESTCISIKEQPMFELGQGISTEKKKYYKKPNKLKQHEPEEMD